MPTLVVRRFLFLILVLLILVLLLLKLVKIQLEYGIIPVQKDVQGDLDLLELVAIVVMPWFITKHIISKM